MKIVTLLFPGITVLDIAGPLEVLSWMPGAQIVHAGLARGEVRGALTDFGLSVDRAIDDVTSADMLIIPGGPGSRALMENARLLEWVRKIHATTQWTTSVCTGSLVLAAAGLLKGLDATTHWNATALLEKHGARYVEKRVVRQGKIVMAAGVSSGIDMALTLLALIKGEEFAKAVQLGIEYDPQPPFDSGSARKATAQTRDTIAAILKDLVAAASRPKGNIPGE